jgi:serine phosphatase RsbU (regulator of sigma subunit)
MGVSGDSAAGAALSSSFGTRQIAGGEDQGGSLARGPSRAAWVALLSGLTLTAALAFTALSLYRHNESRLLNVRSRELASVLGTAVTAIQTPLASAAELADATKGDPQKFRQFMKPYVGPSRQFASASLWPLSSAKPAPTVVVGGPVALAAVPARAHEFLARASKSPLLSVTQIIRSAGPRLGYEFDTPGVKHGFAAYAENPLPKDRRSKIASRSAFSDLNYALYLGHSKRTKDLLVTSVRRLPITGRQASNVVPFGDSAFTLVVTPKRSLGGAFFQSLPLIIVLGGLLLTLAAAAMTNRLARRRAYAEQLAGVLERVASENRELYTEQRSIAQTLQQALLPDLLPEVPGLRISARYISAASGIDIGGDWYDVVKTADGRILLVIGDVSGHGLRAATTMASLRHAALAYATQDCRPASVLSELSDFVNSGDHDYFATVFCALIDVDAHQLTVASAGHLAPLVLSEDDGHFIESDVNVPIGVKRTSAYHETTVSVPPNSTLIAFTDGLVERRGELLDVGLARLRDAAKGHRLQLDDLLAKLAGLTPGEHHDDTAIVAIQWQS